MSRGVTAGQGADNGAFAGLHKGPLCDEDKPDCLFRLFV
jgi:hypothetical protein